MMTDLAMLGHSGAHLLHNASAGTEALFALQMAQILPHKVQKAHTPSTLAGKCNHCYCYQSAESTLPSRAHLLKLPSAKPGHTSF